MISVGHRLNAMESEPRRPTPNGHVSALEPDATRFVAATLPSEKKNRWQTERDGDNGRIKASLISVLMKRKTRAWLIAIDEARVRCKALEACRCRGTLR